MGSRLNKKYLFVILSILVLLGALWIPVICGQGVRLTSIEDEFILPEDRMIPTDEDLVTVKERTLRSGRHNIRLRLTGNGTAYISLTSKNIATLVPNLFSVEGEGVHEIAFLAYTDVDYLHIEMRAQKDSALKIESIEISTRAAMDRRFTISFGLLGAMLILVLRINGSIDRKRLSAVALLCMIAFLASVPCMKDDLGVGDDLYYHWERLTGLVAGLREKQFPVILYPTMNNGYGGVASVFYPDFFLYPVAILVLCGASMQYALHVYLIACNFLSSFAMYALSKKVTRDENAGLIASAFYTLSEYHLLDLYSRSAFGESLAMGLLPLLLFFLLEVIHGNQKRWPLLSLTAAGLFRAHYVTTLLAAVLCGSICLLEVRNIVKGRCIKHLLLAVFFSGTLCLPILFPLYTFMRQGVVAQMMMRDMAYKAVEPSQLFFSTLSNINGAWKNEHLLFRSVEIGVPILVGTIFFVYGEVKGENDKKSNRLLYIFTVFGVMAALMTTTWCPWAKIDVLTHRITSYIQFPWRLLLIAICLLSVPAARAFSRLGNNSVLIGLSLALCFALPLERLQTLEADVIPYGRTNEWLQVFDDYTFEGTASSKAVNRDIRLNGNADIAEVHRVGSDMRINIETREKTEVLLPLYPFEGYRVTLNEEKMNYSLGDENRMAILLPADIKGELHIWYEGKDTWKAGRFIGALSLLLLMILICRYERSAYTIKRQ